MAKVAIVILNWNGQKMLAKFLPNVIEYSRQDAEIWVADNSSSDGSMHLLETQFPLVKTYWSRILALPKGIIGRCAR